MKLRLSSTFAFVFLAFALLSTALLAKEGKWQLKELFKVPKWQKAQKDFPEKDSITPIFYENGACRGKQTEVFAWLALPEGASAKKKVPGIVIVHGGGGTAYRAWAALWQKRGYAAIAMDITGGIPQDEDLDSLACNSVPAANGGPNLNKNCRETKLPFQDQWPVYAVDAIIRANSLLRSLPEVDDKRIGITGISWGAMMGEVAAGLDNRFAFAAFVYGCGFMGDSSFFKETELDKLPEAERKFWLDNFDASNYIGRIKCPVLFANGAKDKHFRPDSWGRSVRLLPTEQVWLSYDIVMKHSHLPYCDPPEIAAFADSWTFGKQKNPQLSSQNGNTAVFKVPNGIAKAVFCWTTDASSWPERNWQTKPASIEGAKVFIDDIPEDATAYFFRIVDKKGLSAASSPIVIQK
ncbi:MAG: acetylxylan esterase [Lentisphaeria bacterium]|nr:acetylxylan esterase [Lentisphaeria bacterium]